VVSDGVGRGMGVLDGGGDRRSRRAVWGREYVVRPIVTIGNFVATRLFPNYFGISCYLFV